MDTLFYLPRPSGTLLSLSMPFAPKLPYPVTTSPAALSTAHSLLKSSITNHAKSLGFDLVGFCKPKIEQKYLDALDSWVKKGAEADMQYMKDSEKLAARSDLSKVLPGVKSVIVLGVNYYYDQPPLKRGYGRVARYAAGRDYHKVIGKMLKKLVKFLGQIEPDKNHKHKGYVDTGPILERALAEQSGIGQIGKNALVITREFGSWIFLAEVLTTIDLGLSSAPNSPASFSLATSTASTVHRDAHSISDPSFPPPSSSLSSNSSSTPFPSPNTDSPQTSLLHKKPFGLCGQCTKCITACPTGAIIAPGVIDSRLCISYLTIENRKKIPPHLAKKIKKTRRLFGCDICQEVCPHNEAKQKPANLPPSWHTTPMKPVSEDASFILPASSPASSWPTRNHSKPAPQKFAKQISLPPAPRASNFPHPIPQPSITTPGIKIGKSQNPQPLAQLPLKKILGIKSEQKFRIYFSSTALMRTKLKGLKRNARAIKN